MPQAPATIGIVAHSPEVRERAYQLYKASRDYARVAVELNVPDGTLRGWSSRDKWAARIATETCVPGLSAEQSASVVKVIASATAPAPIPGSDDDLPEQQARFNGDIRAQALRLPGIMAEMSDRDMVSAADKLSKLHTIAEKALKLTESKGNVLVQIALLSTPTEKQLKTLTSA